MTLHIFLSLRIAYDRGTGRPVGAAVNNSCHKDELSLSLQQELKDVGDASYHPIQAIHHQLRHENEHIFEEIGTNKMFSIKMIGIGEEDRGQGVATNLIRRSILLAGCLGFRAIKTEATGRFSKETFQRVRRSFFCCQSFLILRALNFDVLPLICRSF